MDKIVSYDQYRSITAEAKKNGWTLSNCFFLPQTAKEKAADDSLRRLTLDGGLLILDENEDFYRCYYFLSPALENQKIVLDKPAVIEFPFNSELREKQLFQISLIEKMGFHLGRESALMTASPNQVISTSIEPSDSVEFANAENLGQIDALFVGSFNPLYAFLPGKEELMEAINERRVMVARDQGAVVAALHCGFEKGVAEIKHIAVLPAYRGTGLGKMLMQFYHKQYQPLAARFQQWVDIHNLPAISMYQRFGYEFSLRKANEYILE